VAGVLELCVAAVPDVLTMMTSTLLNIEPIAQVVDSLVCVLS
jgi:hypothetical protein